jgi:hypothetical protein
MSIKDLIDRSKPYKVATSSSLDEISSITESPGFIESYNQQKDRFVPTADFSNPEKFARYGSAEEYYEQSFKRIQNTYPYDGSLKEKINWENSSSYLDLWLYNNEYPRTNGHIVLGQNWGDASLGSTTTVTADSNEHGNDTFIISAKPQYVFIKGGPNEPAVRPYDGKSSVSASYKDEDHKANIFEVADRTKDRMTYGESNLLISGISGSTVEFWFKAGGTEDNSNKFLGPSPCIAFFDMWNSSSIEAGSGKGPSGSYGRFLIEMRRNATELDKLTGDKLFYITYMSGTTGVERAPIGSGSLTGSYPLDQWNHYAFTVKNTSSELQLKLYINGELQDTTNTGSTVGTVDAGPYLANIGAYIHAPTTASAQHWGSGADISYSEEGIGCISGSFDEFRFWKERKDSSTIDRNWFNQVGGGTNTDEANKHLGVYYKFNEGITGTGSTDQTVLDYSGRISNGLIKNYDTSLSMRLTSSAIVQSSASHKEFKDPIIYSYHPEVSNTQDEYVQKGYEYDVRNSSWMYHSLPSWMIEEDEKEGKLVRELTQILASYFDELHTQIENIPRLRDITYMSGAADKPIPFADKLLESKGFFAPEIFADASVIAQFLDRDEERNFDKKLYDIKNFIYENIHNNLAYINKTKGTAKSIRNLIRCFGVDDDLFKINFYADNAEYKLENNFRTTTVRKKYADFSRSDRRRATVFGTTGSSGISAQPGFLTGSNDTSAGFDVDLGMCMEAEVLFPAVPRAGDPNEVSGAYGFLSSSMFGVHSVKTNHNGGAVLDWDSDDYGNFQVYAVRDELTTPNSKNAYFVLTSTEDGILASNEITSSLFYDVYDNNKWNFAVNVKPKSYPNASLVSGSHDDYVVEFIGYNTVDDIAAEEFFVTGTVSNTAGKRFMTQSKRFYVGAHRTNFAGDVLTTSDVRVGGTRVWMIPLEKEEILSHARDATNYGVFNPHQSAYLGEIKNSHGGPIPRIETLALHWNFANVSGSNDDGEFFVDDYSSGSSVYPKRYGNLGLALNKQQTAIGMFFPASHSGSVSNEYIATAKHQQIENLNNENFVQVLDQDDEYFNRRARPVRFFFTVEKSMYQSISDEMIDIFANAKQLQSYGNIIGDPAEKYRPQYKKLRHINSLFFDRINNTPDLDKFTKFYQWLDQSISAMIMNLVPATSDFSGVENVVESHIFERNKYWHKFPTLESKLGDPSGSIKSLNELKYNWRFGHAPLPDTAATATWTFTDKTNETTTITLSDTKGNSVVFEVDNDGDGASGTNTAMDPATNNAAGMGDIMASAVNASILEITATTDGSGKVTLTQDNKGERGDTTITLSNYSNWNANTTDTFPTKFSGGRTPQQKHSLWWKERAERDADNAPSDFATGDVDADATREMIHSSTLQVFDRKFSTPYHFVVDSLVTETAKNIRANYAHLREGANHSFVMKESDVAAKIAVSGSDDSQDLFPPNKIKAGLFANLGDEYYTNLFPFNMYSSSLSTIITNKFKEGLIITDAHRDLYHTFENEPMQGPFTETHVGGNQYRHVSLNKGPKELEVGRNRRRDGTTTTIAVLDDAELRPEGWGIGFGTDGDEKTIKLVGPTQAAHGRNHGTEMPKAIYLRDETAKRPLNIKNIQYTTASQNLGNFHKNYEIFMTSGRNINNHHFKENMGAGTHLHSGSESTFVSGTVDFALPDRSDDSSKTKSVIAERFSAPGEPATLSRGFLDVETESFSPYNALTYRNMTVRNRLHTLLTASSGQFGLNEGYSFPSDPVESSLDSVASYHKINRNTAKRIELKELNADGKPAATYYPATEGGGDDNYTTGSQSDNWYVQHAIPQSDMQYAWITASCSDENVIFGYQQPDHSNAGGASTSISFITASDIVSYVKTSDNFDRAFGIDKTDSRLGAPGGDGATRTDLVPVDFAGMNLNIYEPISGSSNTLGFEGTGSSFYVNVGNEDEQGSATAISGGFVKKNFLIPSVVATANATGLNGILLHRNGPYGYPSWKQIRVGDHPVARFHKRNNTISVFKQEPIPDFDNLDSFSKNNLKTNKLYQFDEAPVTSKYRPLIHSVHTKNGAKMDIKSTYTNDRSHFAIRQAPIVQSDSGLEIGTKNVNFISFFELEPDGPSPNVFPLRDHSTYDHLRKHYITNEIPEDGSVFASLPDAPKGVSSVIYKEIIYPANENAYLVQSRGRENWGRTVAQMSDHVFGDQRPFWRNTLDKRTRLDDGDTTKNSMGYTIEGDHTDGFPSSATSGSASAPSRDLSIWPLDTDGVGGAGYAYVSAEAPANSQYYFGKRNGELSSDTTWTLYYKDYEPTASIAYEYTQLLLFSGAMNSDQSHPYGQYNKSAKIPTYKTNTMIGVNPWFDSYDDYSSDIRLMGQGYSILPEFKISDHMEYYLKNGFFATNNSFLELEGASTKNSSGITMLTASNSENNEKNIPSIISKQQQFIKHYATTKDFEYLGQFQSDHLAANMKANILTLTFNGIMKLLPYQGFYPVLRTVQLASMFSQSYGPHIGPEENRPATYNKDDLFRTDGTRMSALLQPFFAPGIMYNTIKSGVSVHWPAYVGEAGALDSEFGASGYRGAGYISGTEAAEPNFAFPFEALVEPDRYIPVSGNLLSDGEDDYGKVRAVHPNWAGYQGSVAGGVIRGTDGTEAASATFSITFTGAPTNGRKIGLEDLDGNQITGTVDTSATESNRTTIGISGISSNREYAQRFQDWVDYNAGNVAISTVNRTETITLVQNDAGAAGNTGVTEGGGTILNNVTLGGSSDGDEPGNFAGGANASGNQLVNNAYFEWSGDSDEKYSLAMHNFLAEIPNFFLENRSLTTLISKPEDKWKNFDGSKTYYMDVVMNKTEDFVMFEGPASYQNAGTSHTNATGSARGMHYGPNTMFTYDDDTVHTWKANLGDPAPAPWTPPYFYGTSIARIKFSPSKVGIDSGDFGAVFLDDLLAASTIEYFNRNEYATVLNSANAVNTPASASQMQLSSSISLLGKAHPNIIEFAAAADQTSAGSLIPTTVKPGDHPAWVIAPKFECPIMDFSGNEGPTKGASLTDQEKACFNSKGMWKGSGSLPQQNKGIIFGLKESFPKNLPGGKDEDITIGSLVDVCGFSTKPKQLGRLAENKLISEAIVAIPMRSDHSNVGGFGQFIPINPEAYKHIITNIREGLPDVNVTQTNPFINPGQMSGLQIPKTSVGDMIRKMQNYYIPPFFDFTKPEMYDPITMQGAIKPFAMYIFEFEHTLEREDLQKIWQNVMPKIGETARKSSRTISHQVGVPWELIGEITEDIQWVIFKVKRKAANNYFNLTPEFEGTAPLQGAKAELFGKQFDNIDLGGQLPYSYNWPYDFFSLVELAQLEAEVSFDAKNVDQATQLPGMAKPLALEGIEYKLVTCRDFQITSTPPNEAEETS